MNTSPLTVSDLTEIIAALWPVMALQMFFAVLLAHAVMGLGRSLLAFLADLVESRK